MKRILIAANTHSAHGKGVEILRKAERGFAQRGVRCEVLVSQHSGHLFEALPPLLRDPWDAVVALGGDGTLFQVLNCCLKHDGFAAPIGLIPAGTGNSFSKEFCNGVAEPAWQRIIAGAAMPVDVLHCRLAKSEGEYGHEYFFINVLGVGFVSEVNVNALRHKRWGAFAYALAVVLTLAKFKAVHLRLTVDGRLLERKSMFALLCNSRYTGGNMKIAPQAEIDDGAMEVVLLHEVSRVELLRAFPTVFAGTHTHHPKIEMLRCQKLRLEAEPTQLLTPDGEVVGHTPMEVEVLPRRIQFIL